MKEHYNVQGSIFSTLEEAEEAAKRRLLASPADRVVNIYKLAAEVRVTDIVTKSTRT